MTHIGEKYRATAESIAALNRIDNPDRLQANQQIWVPKRQFGLGSLWTKRGLFVVTKPGDSVIGLATTYGVDAHEVVRYNRIRDPKRLAAGQVLFLPGFRPGRQPIRPAPKPTAKPAVAKPTSTPPEREGQLAYPVEPGKFTITSRFGERQSKPHQGVDFAAPRGTPILAADDGVVIVASENLGGYGKTVVILHPNGLRTVYAHADTINVRLGESVKRRQKIAEVGCTGRSTGFHLHFEVRVSADKPVDPMKYLTPK